MPAPDSQETPPISLKALYKHYRKLPIKDIDADLRILDTTALARSPGVTLHETISSDAVRHACLELGISIAEVESSGLPTAYSYSVDSIPGLTVLPGLLPPIAQSRLLDTLLHSCLSDPSNKTNIHAHYTIPYPSPLNSVSSSPYPISFFHHNCLSSPPLFHPLDPTQHHPFSPSQFLTSKLRWLTLGAQYDWTRKLYPASSPTFPPTLKNFLRPLFPALSPEAAIMNLYSPGDTLGVHRDVAETSGRELVSLSLGCEALFLAGLEGKGEVVVRLRSGDCVVMGGDARWAWHAVPRVLAGTCPEGLDQWPAGEAEGDFEDWKGWMKTRRVNLSVRQVSD